MNDYYRMDSTGKDGDIAVEQFKKIATETYKYKIKDALLLDDIFNHYDVVLYDDKIELKVEVKAAKKLRRSDTEPMKHHMWVELFNARGALGWVFGTANIIAQQIDDHFLMINRSMLASFVSERVQNIRASRPEDALYKFYSRKNRKDQITLVNLADLPEECYTTWSSQ